MDDKEKYAARMQRLADLMNRPGWQDFVEHALSQARAALTSNVDTPHKMAMAVGAYSALQAIVEWPSREVAATHAFLNQTSDV